MGTDTFGTSLVGNTTLGTGVGSSTTLGTDVVGGDTLGDNSDSNSGNFFMGVEDGSGSTGGGEDKARLRTFYISRI